MSVRVGTCVHGPDMTACYHVSAVNVGSCARGNSLPTALNSSKLCIISSFISACLVAMLHYGETRVATLYECRHSDLTSGFIATYL